MYGGTVQQKVTRYCARAQGERSTRSHSLAQLSQGEILGNLDAYICIHDALCYERVCAFRKEIVLRCCILLYRAVYGKDRV